MNQASKTVIADLAAATALTNLIGNRYYWELAPKNETAPLLVYRIRENKRPTKDKGGDYDLKVFVYGTTLTEAAEVSDVAKEALAAANYRYTYGESGYTDEEKPEGFIELNFNFKL